MEFNKHIKFHKILLDTASCGQIFLRDADGFGWLSLRL